MSLQQLVNFNHVDYPEGYLKVTGHADSDNKMINISFYGNKASKDAGDAPLKNYPVIVDDESHAVLFSEDALKQVNVSAKLQSYMYLKSLPEYSEALDV
jgi:hypothetical protein